MGDYQTVANEIKEAEKMITNHFIELGVFDYQRVEHFYDYFKHRREEDLGRFLKETQASKLLLQNIKKDFRKIVDHVLFLEKEELKGKESRYDHFDDMLKRTRYLQNLLQNFLKQRKIQISICRSLLSTKNPMDKVPILKKSLSYLQEKRLIVSFGREKELVVLFEGFFKQEKERIEQTFQTYLNEHKQDPTQASLTIVVLVPIVGSALALAVYASLQWATHYSINHKMLKPGSHRRHHGSAV